LRFDYVHSFERDGRHSRSVHWMPPGNIELDALRDMTQKSGLKGASSSGSAHET
jgi:hypothetical protein